MTYALTIRNGYTIIKISEKLFLLDTGSRRSVSVGNDLLDVMIEERDFNLCFCPMIAEQLKKATGLPVVGMIGMDIINDFGGVECDLERGVATFGPTEKRDGIVVPFEKPNDFHFRVKVNGKDAFGFLDVGAPKPMIDEHSLIEKTLFEGMVEKPSTTGDIETAQYGGTMEFGGVTKPVHMLKSVRDMCRDGSDVYFSVLSFAEKYYAIDLNNQEVCFL